MDNSKSGHASIPEDRGDKSEKSRMIVKIRPRVRVKKKPRARIKRVISMNPPSSSSRESVKETPSFEDNISATENSLEEDEVSEIITLLERARTRSRGSVENEAIITESTPSPKAIKTEQKRKKTSYY
jgi:hypothetical protein